uniref:alpha-N-acetylgalactosaminide alpha-2,6-sialyltransferase n=1 Tax=Salmo trutta TaxID=8032 RepID=A0A674F3Y0_SALTR
VTLCCLSVPFIFLSSVFCYSHRVCCSDSVESLCIYTPCVQRPVQNSPSGIPAMQIFTRPLLPTQLFIDRNQLSSVSEWNRLAHFNNPFGFMGYNLSLSLSLDLCLCVNISGMGNVIDACDFVFRMNGAVTAGFEHDVGSRTSVYVHTSFSIITSLGSLKKQGFRQTKITLTWNPHSIFFYLCVLIPQGSIDCNFLESLMKNRRIPAEKCNGWTLRSYYGGHFNKSSYYFLLPDYLRYIWTICIESHPPPANPSFTLLLLSVHHISGAYGFSTLDYKYPNYYYDKQHSPILFVVNHDYIKEMKTWK